MFKMFANSPRFTHCPLQKTTCPDWTIMLRANYRCVQSLDISVDLAKCCKMFTNSPSSLTFCPLQKTTCPDWTIYSWQGFNSLRCPLMLRANYRCVQSLNISVDVAKCVENVHKFIQMTYFLSVAKNYLSLMNNLVMARFQLNRMSSYANNIQ